MDGRDETARCVCILSAVAIGEARENYEEKHNKGTFVKNIISDNILPGDIYVRAKELHFVTDIPRAVLLVRQVNKSDVSAVEIIQSLFPDRQKDFVLSMSESDIVVIKELSPDFTSEDITAIARSVEDTLTSELGVRTVIGIAPRPGISGSWRTATRKPRLPLRWERFLIRKRASSTTKTWVLGVSSINSQPRCARCS